MPKPDKVMRFRPLNEVGEAISKLKQVVLIHPKPIVEELPPKFCVCGKGVVKKGKRSKNMVQCGQCWEWFHYDCVGLGDEEEVAEVDWECDWCLSVTDKSGYQRWTRGRKKAKLRHQNDRPKLQGAVLGGDPPKRHSAPPTWEGKVLQVQELARRAAVKKKKLTEAAEKLVSEGAHHLADAEGMAGLELRPVDDAMLDEMVGAGVIQSDSEEGDGGDE